MYEEKKMTVNVQEEDILKESLMEGIILDDVDYVTEGLFDGQKKAEKAGKPLKEYGKIAGLSSIGKTFFCSRKDVSEKLKDAQNQMVQKYGAEVYGANAQLAGRDGSSSSLISCTVTPLMTLKEAKSKPDPKQFANALELLKGYIEKMMKNQDWLKSHEGAETVLKNLKQIKPENGAAEPTNQKSLKAVMDIIQKKGSQWDADIKADKKDDRLLKGIGFGKVIANMREGWKVMSGGKGVDGKDDKSEFGSVSSNLGGGYSDSSEVWERNLAYQIKIHTNYSEDWYKRKFKSGLLNKAIFAIKTSAMAHSANTAAASDKSGHKYTQNDELEGGELRKLDSIKWKMTNKVAKDFVTIFCGWSRKKEMYQDGEGFHPAGVLVEDRGFGGKMAKKALGGRGLLGRLKQKIFSGGQDSASITVAFQMADYYDGWKIVKRKTEPEKGEEGKEGKGDGGKGEEGGEGGNNGGKKGGLTIQQVGVRQKGVDAKINNPDLNVKGAASVGSGGQKEKAQAQQGSDKPQGNNQKDYGSKENRQKGDNGKSGDSENKSPDKGAEKDNKSGTNTKQDNSKDDGNNRKDYDVAKESTSEEDPFADLFTESGELIDDERYDLVKEACESGEGLDALIQVCLEG